MTPSDPPATVAEQRPLLAVIVLGFSSLSVSLMQALVIPIQSDLPELLDTTASTASWVVTATLLGGAVAMPVAGRFADIYGKRPVLVATSLVLLVGALLSAATDGVAPMLIGRVLQGAALGYIPVAIAMVREVTPPRITNTALATVSATLGVGAALGLPLAAWIAQAMDWRALFWLAAGLASAMAVLSATVLPAPTDRRPARIDWVGAAGLITGLVSVLVGLTKANSWGWTSPLTIGLMLTGALVLVAWGAYELRRRDPLVDLRTTAHLPVLFTNLAAAMIGFGMMAQAIIIPQLLQMPATTGFGLGQSVLQTGLWMAPGGLMMLAFSPVSSMLLTRIGGRPTLAIAGAVLAAGYLLGAFMMNAPWQLLIASSVASAGVGIGYAAMPTLILDNVPTSEASAGVGVNALMRSIGTTSAGAVMAVVLTAGTITVGDGTSAPSHAAFQACFLIAGAAAVIAVVLTLLIPRSAGGAVDRTLVTHQVASGVSERNDGRVVADAPQPAPTLPHPWGMTVKAAKGSSVGGREEPRHTEHARPARCAVPRYRTS